MSHASRILMISAVLMLVGGCSSTTLPPILTQCQVSQNLMIPPPSQLEQIDSDVVKTGNLDLALPVIERNYKTYYHVAEQLNGLQQQIQIQQEQDHDKAN